MFFACISSFAVRAFACQPCAEFLSMQDAVDEADLVIIGRRTDYKKDEKMPEGITIYVERVLKGDIEPFSEITVRTMYGMCPYGVYMKDETALVFLKKLEKPKWSWQAIIPHRFDYTSVSYGCAPKAIPFVDGKVKIGDLFFTADELEDGQALIFPPKKVYAPPPEKENVIEGNSE